MYNQDHSFGTVHNVKMWYVTTLSEIKTLSETTRSEINMAK